MSMILCVLVALGAYLPGLSFVYNILITQYLMPGFASGSTSCFICLKFSGLNEICFPAQITLPLSYIPRLRPAPAAIPPAVFPRR